MAYYKVHNLREGGRDGNWLAYWEKATGKKANLCHNILCSSKATDGAHVQLDTPYDNRWYIVPLCHRCNCQFGEHFTVSGPLVSATDSSVILWQNVKGCAIESEFSLWLFPFIIICRQSEMGL